MIALDAQLGVCNFVRPWYPTTRATLSDKSVMCRLNHTVCCPNKFWRKKKVCLKKIKKKRKKKGLKCAGHSVRDYEGSYMREVV